MFYKTFEDGEQDNATNQISYSSFGFRKADHK
jgi:hypothetical protein